MTTAQIVRVDRTPRSRVESIGTGIDILKALARLGGEAGLTRIASATSAAPSKVHRYLMGLVEGGLVERTQEGSYRLAAEAMTIGFAAIQANQPVALAAEVLPVLRDALGASCCAAVLANMGPTVVRVEEAHGAIVLNIRLGSVLPPSRSATGRVFMAFGPDPMLQEQPAETATIGYAPEQSFDRIRSEGYAWIRDTLVAGTSALSVPVFDRHGAVVVALATLGPTGTLDTSPAGAPATLMKDTARRISAQLGYSGAAGDRPASTF